MRIFGLYHKSLTLGLTLVMLAAFSIYSCTDDTGDNEYTSVSANSESILQFAGSRINHVNTHFIDTEKNQGYIKPFHIMTTGLNALNFNNVFSKIVKSAQIESLMPSSTRAETIVLYLKENSTKNVQIKDIVGMSMWFPKSNGVKQHRLYLLNESSKFVLDPTYSIDCETISRSDINHLATTVLKQHTEVTWVAYLLEKGKTTKTKDVDKPILPEFTRTVMNRADVILVERALNGCFACGGDEGFDCQIDDRGQFYCAGLFPGPGTCLGTSLDQQNKAGKMNSEFDLTRIRSIRDNLMSKSPLGKTYIDYYYKISKIGNIYNSDLNLTSTLNHIDLAVDLVSAANSFEHGKPHETLIDQDLKEKSLTMIKSYKTMSSNKEFQNILKNIEQDINMLSLKDNAQVKQYININ